MQGLGQVGLVAVAASHVAQRAGQVSGGLAHAAVLAQPGHGDLEWLRHVDQCRRHRSAQVLREQHAAHGLAFLLRVLDVAAQAHGHVAQLALLLRDALDGLLQRARVQATGRQARIGIHEAGQHPAHVLAVAGDALAVDQALQRAVVVLGELQVGLESLVLRVGAIATQAQHVAELLQALRGDALEQLECLGAHGALGDGRAGEGLFHGGLHLVRLVD